MRITLWIAAFILLLCVAAWATGYGYLIKGVRLTYLKGKPSATIYDMADFDTRPVARGNVVYPLPRSSAYNKVPLTDALKSMLAETGTTSFLVLCRDSIVWEYYYEEHTDSTVSNSFSMAKTITTLLVQKAIEEGKIPSWDSKVQHYLPWLKGPYATELTLRHLSTMTAGLDWQESYYDPFGITARAYYDDDLEKVMHRVNVVYKPGESYAYQSGATQLLGLCLKKATGMPVSEYASQALWAPLGAESGAWWHTDDADGLELTYCCFNATTRDFARLGLMVLHGGKINQQQVVKQDFIDTATKPFRAAWYGHSFWLGNTGAVKWHFFHGHHGQNIIVVPEKELVIVRTGHRLKRRGRNPVKDCTRTYAEACIATWGE